VKAYTETETKKCQYTIRITKVQ